MSIVTFRYRLAHLLLRWVQDEEGDIGLTVANIVTFLKYKEHTIIRFGGRRYANAPKRVREAS